MFSYKSLILFLCRVCFEEFGDSVKFWITLNEPKETSLQVDYVFTIDEMFMGTSLHDQGRGAIMMMTMMRTIMRVPTIMMMVMMMMMTTTRTTQS